MQHLKPINLSGRPAQRRPLKSAPSLSCDYPNFDYSVSVNPIDAKVLSRVQEKKEKVAA